MNTSQKNQFRRFLWPKTLSLSQKKIPILSPRNIRLVRNYTTIRTSPLDWSKKTVWDEILRPTSTRDRKTISLCHIRQMTLQGLSSEIPACSRPISLYWKWDKKRSRCLLRFLNRGGQEEAQRLWHFCFLIPLMTIYDNNFLPISRRCDNHNRGLKTIQDLSRRSPFTTRLSPRILRIWDCSWCSANVRTQGRTVHTISLAIRYPILIKIERWCRKWFLSSSKYTRGYF